MNQDNNLNLPQSSSPPVFSPLMIQGSKVTVRFSQMKNDKLPIFIREMLCTAYLEQVKMNHK